MHSHNSFIITAAALALACAGSGQAQSQAFDSAKAWDHVRAQIAIGPRVAGTPANASARKHIIDTLAGFGIKAVEQSFTASTPQGPVAMANVIATLPGKSPDRILLASHFDTKLFRDARFVGANDGASSTAALLELGRVLAARDARPFTIELVFFDGEEAVVEWSPTDGTYGSRHYVDAARSAGTLKAVRALVLLDMIGDRSLGLKREGNSTRWLTDLIWAAAHKLGHHSHFLDETTIIEDDHLPFLRAGIPAVDLIDLEYTAWHTPADTIDQISAKSLQVVGDVVLAALPEIERRLSR
jgi:glutaminyl-peptide cyclotransferase